MIWFAVLAAAVIGAIVGGVVGLFSGGVLAFYRDWLGDSGRRARTVGFGAAATPFVLIGLVSLVRFDASAELTYGVLAVISGTAGAALAPCVVHGPPQPSPLLHD